MIGLLGGTFDPVHHGHLRIALEAKEALGLTEVRFIPCRQPPHRGDASATAQQRLDLLRLACGDMPGFAVDTRELERPGPSYMVDTLASLRAERGDEPLCLILGWDAFLGLPGWHRWQNLLDYAHLAVVQRPGSTDRVGWVEPSLPIELARWVTTPRPILLAEAGPCRKAHPANEAALAHLIETCQREPAQLRVTPAGGIGFLPVSQLDISASHIRALLYAGHDPHYLLPDAVLKSIRQTGLYHLKQQGNNPCPTVLKECKGIAAEKWRSAGRLRQ